MTTGDIANHLADVYGDSASKELVSKVTDQVTEAMTEWQSRPLDPVYPVILIDAIMLKVRDGQVANRPVYVAMGISLDGERDVLGMLLGPSGGEGAKHWLSMLTELRNRGVADVCIVSCDGLKGLPEAINATWPKRWCRRVWCTWCATACATPRRSTGRRSPPMAFRARRSRPVPVSGLPVVTAVLAVAPDDPPSKLGLAEALFVLGEEDDLPRVQELLEEVVELGGYYAAIEQDYFAAEGLEVELRERDPARDPVDDVLDGTADYGVTDTGLVLATSRFDDPDLLHNGSASLGRRPRRWPRCG